MLSDGKVLNKRKRYNLCFADFHQEPNYEEGEGRVISFRDSPTLGDIRDRLENDLYEALAVSVTLVVVLVITVMPRVTLLHDYVWRSGRKTPTE